MGGNYLRNHRMVSRWENSLNTPPEDRNYPLCSCCAEPIWDELYKIDKKLYCEDCAKASFKMWLNDGATVECEGCGETIAEDDCYYDVGNEPYCQTCFQKYFTE